MIATLKESKARLSELVAMAARGEEIIITVHGKPKARLAAIASPAPPKMAGWVRQLRALQQACGTGREPVDGATVLRDLRDDRA
jgi:prevent-host-death family protein